jgi:hypothetical protein
MKETDLEHHRAIVDLAVLVVAATGAYFNAPIGSGEEEVTEEVLDSILDLVGLLPSATTSSLVLALSSLVVAHLNADEVERWAEAELSASERLG